MKAFQNLVSLNLATTLKRYLITRALNIKKATGARIKEKISEPITIELLNLVNGTIGML